MWGPTGWNRLFLADFGGQIAWLIPAALILLVAGLWMTRCAPRTDRTRAGFLLWGGVLLVSGAVISLSSGIIHPYYTVALAPPVGAIVGMGVVTLWGRRDRLPWRLVLAATLAATVVCSYVLLGRSPDWYPWLRWAVIVLGLLAAAGLALASHRRGRLSAGLAVAGLLTGLAGTTAYTLDTVLTPHTGAIVSAGPAVAGGGLGRPGGPAGGGAGPAGRAGFGPGPGGFAPPGGVGGGPGGAVGAFGGGPPGGFGGGPGAAGPGGGLLQSSAPGSALVALLSTDTGHYTWVAATVGANSAAGYQLATGAPVMAIGGFNGSDPTPTLAQFEAAVQQHRIHYFIAGGRGGGPGGGASTPAAITTWVQSTFTASSVDGVTVYDLTVPAPS
jgi:hypothetical protein